MQRNVSVADQSAGKVIRNIVSPTSVSNNLLRSVQNHVLFWWKTRVAGIKVINRLYLSGRTSKSKYPIDTGADVSVVHMTAATKHRPLASLELFTANGTPFQLTISVC
ncbi:hypothetical protein NPIL_550051 [Nephila pilipes]|uniref:Peptidase A2 domain-containing protein n=1 Tax=Nephila pilipes TaxID=299642 RepID=A0A8X6NVS3_NEPPI|nr:hypothetical protein NPIL_550051 [Nephila pilipes]